ncbi:colicin E3/pyocin S6 family cytotoxin [Streptomyces sp. NPDC004237]|uniref:colicin E3/pyocin S6 family cytotoxin n=1 Tax=Streptomyces sp. NPDC004237 TaxID=3154455 RepID=UPI0033A983DC
MTSTDDSRRWRHSGSSPWPTGGTPSAGSSPVSSPWVSSPTASTSRGEVHALELPVLEEAAPYKGKTKSNGKSGSKKRYFEWDYTHGDIGVYDKNGKHLGSADPNGGHIYKPPVKGRKINP